jgi:hypothetical protein
MEPARQIQAGFRVARDPDGEILRRQAVADQKGQVALVLDDEDLVFDP